MLLIPDFFYRTLFLYLKASVVVVFDAQVPKLYLQTPPKAMLIVI
jgi:hypothetical protein